MGKLNQEKFYSAVIFNAHFLAVVPLSCEDAPFLLFPLLLVLTSAAPININQRYWEIEPLFSVTNSKDEF
jgi:hypothetical protein